MTTSILQSLLAGVISNPDEDTPRLMYADELLETGNLFDASLAEYINLSIELSNHRKMGRAKREGESEPPIRHGEYYKKGQKLVEELNRKWNHSDVSLHPTIYLYHTKKNNLHFEMERGFIKSITCTASEFLSICNKLIWHESMEDDVYLPDPASGRTTGEWISGEKVTRRCPLTAHPVREVRLTNYPHIINIDYKKVMEWLKLAPNYNLKITVND